MVNEDRDAVHRPFGGYTVETETLPDGRRIRYYAWPDDADEAVDAAEDARDANR